jgi:outer membrane beta-barrel protein
MMKRIALSFLLASTLAALPSAARAEHKSPLADAPAIRKRVELRDKRFEIGVGAGSTVNETFYHDILLNAHLAFHITDWLAIGGAGLFNATSLATGFHDELTSTLKNPQDGGRAPNVATANAGMNKPSMILAGQLELTPFTGKFSIFGKLFAHYDFFLFGGPAYVTLVKANSATVTENGKNVTECVEKSTDQSIQTCYNTGGAIGATFGGGLHAYFNDFVGLSAELRDTLNRDNPAGRDVNGDQYADKRDLNWSGHWTFTLGVTVFFPKPDISP